MNGRVYRFIAISQVKPFEQYYIFSQVRNGPKHLNNNNSYLEYMANLLQWTGWPFISFLLIIAWIAYLAYNAYQKWSRGT